MKAKWILGVSLLFGILAGNGFAQDALEHPPVPFLDETGSLVLQSGKPLSLKKTCGACHDTNYIASHSYHVSLGSEGDHALRFDPITYDDFIPEKANADSLAYWIRTRGVRHVGGGFSELTPKGGNFDFSASGTTEMNCFLCHLPKPDSEARKKELYAGHFSWAPTATLGKTGIVFFDRKAKSWNWNKAAFNKDGAVEASGLGLALPRSSNCGQCHGAVRSKRGEPFFLKPSASNPETETTGVIFSSDRIRVSGMNIKAKDKLSRAWDVHAERLLECSSCHGSLNNPANYREDKETRPKHLAVEPRRLDLKEFLRTPSHDFAKGHVSQSNLARNLDGTMRRCENCHNAEETHEFLPYPKRHFTAMQCEACHIPRLYAPTRQQTDWTLLSLDGSARVIYRGVDGDPNDPRTLVSGYTPVLLPRKELDGSKKLVPQNLMSTFYWVDETSGFRVPLERLKEALFVGGAYRPEVVKALDRNGDGKLGDKELRLDSVARTEAISKLLKNHGVAKPAIRGEILPFGIHHGVAPGNWSTRDCQVCHGANSRFGESFVLASYLPGGVQPSLKKDAIVNLVGEVRQAEDGSLVYFSDPTAAGVSILGFGKNRLVDQIGLWAVILVICGVFVHGGTRVFLYFYARNGRAAPGKGPLVKGSNPGKDSSGEVTA
jgi:mono/diheme cytochrome c family protein